MNLLKAALHVSSVLALGIRQFELNMTLLGRSRGTPNRSAGGDNEGPGATFQLVLPLRREDI